MTLLASRWAEPGHQTMSSISSPGSVAGLWQVSCGEVALLEPFTKLQGAEISHRWPQVLPGGQAVLFTSRTGPGADEHQVQVQRVSSGERRMLAQGESGYYVPTGHLVYVQSSDRDAGGGAIRSDAPSGRSRRACRPLPRESWWAEKARTIRRPTTGCWPMLPAAATTKTEPWCGWTETGSPIQ